MNDMPIIVHPDNTALISWLAACNKLRDDYIAKNYAANPREILVASVGTRYIRIEQQSISKNPATGKPFSCSAWAFIDRTTGDVLKASSFKTPAKGSRGNIFNPDNGMSRIGPYGPAYNRG